MSCDWHGDDTPPDAESTHATPLCGTFQHRWQEAYYGWRCKVCDLFVPFGHEPWGILDGWEDPDAY